VPELRARGHEAVAVDLPGADESAGLPEYAEAGVAARQRIVAGAVGMVEMALCQLAEHDLVELDTERKAAMVSNLLVVLCSDHATQPVVNTGSLYH